MRKSWIALAVCAGLSWPVAGLAYLCEEIDLTSPSGWIWRAHEGDDYFETYIYTFKEDGTLLLQESMPGNRFKKGAATWRLDGRGIKIKFNSGMLMGEEINMPCNFFNGQLQLTMNGETYVFDPQMDD
ncbi:hypothetical protein AGMMS50256_34090 [Betaproteobacteria bacterium]|nr:hypothetical protein AGMMS50256_34090 [Betaproteobacteria bacterium]